ncbi:hypothetical protein CDAR_305161 [Caerostris darwini]|uniref:Uncharacterized protein n=1 Tax=Caerostris darwini TaxID=1538125 RepID=A0AAV4RD38_9ARAC|nr:hypothetical protein CDAR_305161 [Caerostris darwini]
MNLAQKTRTRMIKGKEQKKKKINLFVHQKFFIFFKSGFPPSEERRTISRNRHDMGFSVSDFQCGYFFSSVAVFFSQRENLDDDDDGLMDSRMQCGGKWLDVGHGHKDCI